MNRLRAQSGDEPVRRLPSWAKDFIEDIKAKRADPLKLLDRGFSLYSEYQRTGDKEKLREAAGILFELRELYFNKKVALSKEVLQKINFVVAENANDYIESICGHIPR